MHLNTTTHHHHHHHQHHPQHQMQPHHEQHHHDQQQQQQQQLHQQTQQQMQQQSECYSGHFSQLQEARTQKRLQQSQIWSDKHRDWAPQQHPEPTSCGPSFAALGLQTLEHAALMCVEASADWWWEQLDALCLDEETHDFRGRLTRCLAAAAATRTASGNESGTPFLGVAQSIREPRIRALLALLRLWAQIGQVLGHLVCNGGPKRKAAWDAY
eukprot:TRINITY_DN5858_c0_g3_i2.p1 TRINITY_DN5858_c0_g3~~TRINITY_DN5858_c0_g3_i2.p1  ORF type:complete len:213 (-),score=48.12 TRINITY_DN5858_c0_g3_i2:229-867(-)